MPPVSRPIGGRAGMTPRRSLPLSVSIAAVLPASLLYFATRTNLRFQGNWLFHIAELIFIRRNKGSSAVPLRLGLTRSFSATIEVIARTGLRQFDHLIETLVEFLIRQGRRGKPRAVIRRHPQMG